jgi:hypothetical protein
VPPTSTATRTNTQPAATATATRTQTPTNSVPPTSTATRTNTQPAATATATRTQTPTTTATATSTVAPATATPATAICNFNEAGATDNSDLDLRVQGNSSLGGLVSDVAGAIEISCSATGANGKRSCTCELQSWTPASIIGIGFICIDPAPGCAAGEVDCNGGNVLGLDTLDDAQIGTCTSHATCSASCDTYCSGLGKVQWRSGCENFCQGGTRDGQACICDTFNGAGCSGGVSGVNDCPGGSCVGKNNEADTDCQCQCIDYTAGGASDPGDIQCNLGSDLKVVNTLPCSNPALVDLPPACFPFTSQSVTAQSIQSNENASATIGPNTSTGTPESCSNFDLGTVTGYELVTDVGFFDSTIGDLRALLRADCQ